MLAGLFQAALSLAIVLYAGQRLSQALQSSIASMVTACVNKQMQDDNTDRTHLPALGLAFGMQPASAGQILAVASRLIVVPRLVIGQHVQRKSNKAHQHQEADEHECLAVAILSAELWLHVA